MCFSGTDLSLCFRYKLLTLSMGSTVILDFYCSKQLWRFPLKCCPNAGMAPPFSQREAGLPCTAIVTDSPPSSSFQWWQRLPPLHVATRPACKLCGMLREEEDSGTNRSPGMSIPAARRTGQRKITQGCSLRGQGLEDNTPWFQPDHPFVQETNPSQKLVENTTQA